MLAHFFALLLVPSIQALDIFNDGLPMNLTYVAKDSSPPFTSFTLYDQLQTETAAFDAIQARFGSQCQKKDPSTVKDIICQKGLNATSFTLECAKKPREDSEWPKMNQETYKVSECQVVYVSSGNTSKSASPGKSKKYVYINMTLVQDKIGNDPVTLLDPDAQSSRRNTILTEFDDLYILSTTLLNTQTKKPICSMEIIRGMNKIQCPGLQHGRLSSIPFRCSVNPALKTKPALFGIDHCVLLAKVTDAFSGNLVKDIANSKV